MSKIRVYELAKEAGVDSKVLTAKLRELGYNVKAYNSTLDEDVADEIRKQVIEGGEPAADVAADSNQVEEVTEVITEETAGSQTATEEKRIQRKGQTTIIRRRTRTVAVEEAEEPVAAEPAMQAAEEVVAAHAPAEEPAVAAPEPVAPPVEMAKEPEAEAGGDRTRSRGCSRSCR